MQKNSKRPLLAYLMVGLLLLAAVLYIARPYLNNKPFPAGPSAPPKANVPQIPIPVFNADSAYLFVQKQVAFGPRVPNSAAHKKCAAWFVQEFKRHGMSVIEQPFKAPHFKGGQWEGINIIAQYRPDIPKRILLAAHWDSRFQADKDTKDKEKPIDGADDGASGVAVLLEIARTLADNPVDIGVDLILFDVEDQGNDQSNNAETWCLGSQHWAANLHSPGYMPYYAILLDMVGARDARFYKEGFSREVAPRLVEKVWSLAQSLGYGEYFVNENKSAITDDHIFVIRKARIPMIDIISMPNQGESPFGSYHHTHDDNISVIDPNVLKAVGQTMTALIYKVHNQVF